MGPGARSSPGLRFWPTAARLAGGPRDRRIAGKAVYEAVGKDKDGKDVDLVITEDGKLANMKYDGAADKAQEEGRRAKGGRRRSPR